MVSQFCSAIAAGQEQDVRKLANPRVGRGHRVARAAVPCTAWTHVVVVADTSGLSGLSRNPLVSTAPLDDSPRSIATALCCGRKRQAPPHHSLLSSWDDCVNRLPATYERVLLCAS